MRVVAFSDPHGDLPPLGSLPNGDVLVIAGDVAPDFRERSGSHAHQLNWWGTVMFRWLREAQGAFPHVIVTGGNHDFALQGDGAAVYEMLSPLGGVHLLLDDLVEIGGVAFFGSPWCPEFGRRWAFEASEEELARRYAPIAEGKGGPLVVVAHTPPRGYRDDLVVEGTPQPLGSVALTKALLVSEAQIPLLICGHLHGARGEAIMRRGERSTLVANVAMLDEAYRPYPRAWMAFELDAETGDLGEGKEVVEA